MELLASDPLARSLTDAIHTGNLDALRELLQTHTGLANSRIANDKGVVCTPLHVAVDWPGHFPRIAESIALLIAQGADPNVQITGAGYHAETPLHGAASSDDVAALDALLDGGADIEYPGAVFTGGPAMSDAVIFANFRAARRLLERGAKTTLTQAAALGLKEQVQRLAAGQSREDLTAALWHACRGGQREVAEFLVGFGADLNWVGWDHLTPLDTAKKSGNGELVRWLESLGARGGRE